MLPDRSLLLAPGELIKSGYVSVWKVRLACRERMAVGDVGNAFQKLLTIAPAQMHPAPNGYWDGDEFVILDGRHAYVAAVMLGYEQILVCWKE